MRLRVLYYQDGMVRDIPYKSVEFSGDASQAYRSCTVEVSNTIDGRTKLIPFKVGGELRLLYDNKEIFRGIIFEIGINAEGSQSLTVHDYNVYLTKNSDTVRFEKLTATQIISALCNKFGIQVGTLVDTRYVIERLIERGKTIYEIILDALIETQKATGKRYRLRNIEGKLELVDVDAPHERLIIENRRNIIGATFSESIEDTRTRVKLTGGDEERPVTVEVSSPNAAQYGVMQHYEHNSDVNTVSELRPLANELLAQLSLPKQEFSIEAIGDIDVISAKTVEVNESMTGINGAFYIESDSHKFEANGMHIMSLSLSRKGGG